MHILQSQNLVHMHQRRCQAPFFGDVESGGEEMAGIEAVADGEAALPRRQFPDTLQLLQFSADLRPGAYSVLEQDSQAVELQTIRSPSNRRPSQSQPATAPRRPTNWTRCGFRRRRRAG